MARAVGAGTAARPARTPADQQPGPRKPGVQGVPSWTAAAAAGLLPFSPDSQRPAAVCAWASCWSWCFHCGCVHGHARSGGPCCAPAALLLPVVLSASGNLRAAAADPGVPLPFIPAALWQQLLGYPEAFGSSDPVAGSRIPARRVHGPWFLPCWSAARSLPCQPRTVPAQPCRNCPPRLADGDRGPRIICGMRPTW